jgi:hypothetical protein
VRSSSGRRPTPAPIGGDRRWWRRLPILALATGLAVLVVAGCGSSGPPPPWRSGHPDPGSLSLLDSAQAGSCASKAPDPNQAPAAISFQGQEYVQSSPQPASASLPGAVEIDHTGNWSFWGGTGSGIMVVTPQADYLYQLKNC